VLVVVVSGLFVVMQFIRPERSNPPVDPARTLEARLAVPADVAGILERSCQDCHTHKTRWPWYSRFAPGSWLLARDVNEARDELNLSEWDSYDEETAAEQLEAMCEETKEGEMPLRPYTWLHPGARLSSADVEQLCAWTERARREIGAADR
jgi:hypothetical protein